MKSIGNGCTSKISQSYIDQNQPTLAQPKNKKNMFIKGINRLFNTGLFNKLLKHPKKTEKTEIAPLHPSFVKLVMPEKPLQETQKKTNLVSNKVHIEPIVHIEPKIAKTVPSEIDQFTESLHRLNITFKDNSFGANHRPTFLVKNRSEHRTITLDNRHYLGKGEYGTAYRVGDFVIKIPHRDLIFEYNKYAEYERCARVLNEVNQDVEFARYTTLENGNVILVTKFIDGKSIKGREAFDFVQSRGRIIFDPDAEGNVKKDRQNNLFLIDADFAAQPKQLNRTLSVGTMEIYNRYRK
ncbi:TPA: hypothetical protein ACS7ZY_002931 [Providencia alcalifaciens]